MQVRLHLHGVEAVQRGGAVGDVEVVRGPDGFVLAVDGRVCVGVGEGEGRTIVQGERSGEGIDKRVCEGGSEEVEDKNTEEATSKPHSESGVRDDFGGTVALFLTYIPFEQTPKTLGPMESHPRCHSCMPTRAG